MATVKGPLLASRRLLMEVSNRIMLCESEIWSQALEVKKRANSVLSAQRTAALRISLAYLIVSVPVNLLAAERMEIYKAKLVGNHIISHFSQNTITKWQ